MFVLKYDGKEIKRHSTIRACIIEAYERGWIYTGPFIPDFPGDPVGGKWLHERATILTDQEDK